MIQARKIKVSGYFVIVRAASRDCFEKRQVSALTNN